MIGIFSRHALAGKPAEEFDGTSARGLILHIRPGAAFSLLNRPDYSADGLTRSCNPLPGIGHVLEHDAVFRLGGDMGEIRHSPAFLRLRLAVSRLAASAICGSMLYECALQSSLHYSN
jgi:hypothetical protein